MHGFDVGRFVRERSPSWEALAALLRDVEERGLGSLDLPAARRLGKLYRGASGDLVRARAELVDATVVDYLNDLVARAYAQLHGERRSPLPGRLRRFYAAGFPRLFRRESRAIALAALLLFGGAAFGATFTAIDPGALGVLIPEQHQGQTPRERVGEEENGGGLSDGQRAVAFASMLFTHNIKVTFLVFALGITFGLGTVAVLIFNGVPLGALAMQYHLAGEGLFFWGWILPHGIPELTQIAIAGGAGLILARGLLLPGRQRRRDALAREAKTAARLVLGGMPILILAGVIEGTISQMHAPAIPYAAKLVFAVLVGAGLYAYLLLAGRGRDTTEVTASDRTVASDR
ncbi:MAG: stage II sporulation protein M [Deltaproteobacteria bacterium]|nr:MAG: stage II sporulation protein M [Deltaproteobacteria bacterium]